jgi:hypothetical protein
MGEWRYNSTILDLGTRWLWMVSFTHRPLYSRRKTSLYPLDRKLGGPHNRVWTLWRRDKYFAPSGNRTPAAQPVAHRYTDWAIPSLGWIMNDELVEGKLFSIFQCVILAFAWRNRGKPRKIWARLVSVTDETRIEHLVNTDQSFTNSAKLLSGRKWVWPNWSTTLCQHLSEGTEANHE